MIHQRLMLPLLSDLLQIAPLPLLVLFFVDSLTKRFEICLLVEKHKAQVKYAGEKNRAV